jgi:aspartyl-tRNA(Asn)/glutamyl-tRNA(Gln) amidotransferase subunit A
MASLGAEIVSIDLPFALADLNWMINVISAEAYVFHRDLAADPSTRLGEVTRARIMSGERLSAAEYISTKQRQAEFRLRLNQAMEGIDALLTPTTETAAILLRDVDETTYPSRYTRFVNYFDLCALSVPNGFTAHGLPLSLQIVCKSFEEVTALRIGHAYQLSTEWHERVPVMCTG